MEKQEHIELHELEAIEQNLAVGTERDADAGDGFMIISASGFMIISASGFMII
jgi:hypothetical protein